MRLAPGMVVNVVAAFGAMIAALLLDVSAAYAQSASCARLFATLDTLERNAAFRDSEGMRREARAIAEEVQRAESAYIRTGCNADAKAGRPLNRQCQGLAQQILAGRDRVEQFNTALLTGDAIGQQREAVLQEIARFGCQDPSRAELTRTNRGSLFDQIFGNISDSFDGGGGFRGGEFDPFGDFHTVRTLCVRKSDGFYWPVSYSTLVDYVPNDLQQCYDQCPGVDVDLYYYDNPGQEPEQMINMYGEPYTALPTAFAFRNTFDIANSCRKQVNYGSINLTQMGDGQSRAMIAFNDLNFPLPLRDPRQVRAVETAAIETIEYVDIPLPRRRPAAPGEEAPVVPAVDNSKQRIVKFGDKRVRIVGPETPYALAGAAGT